MEKERTTAETITEMANTENSINKIKEYRGGALRFIILIGCGYCLNNILGFSSSTSALVCILSLISVDWLLLTWMICTLKSYKKKLK